MEHQEERLDVGNLVCTPTDTDLGIPMSPTHLPLSSPTQPFETAGKKPERGFELPGLSCNPTDVGLVQDCLRPAIKLMQPQPEEPTPSDPFRLQRGGGVVNPDLPCKDPWELPGHHNDHEFGAPSEDTSLNSPHPGSRPMHYYPKHHSDPRLKSYIEQLGNLLFSDSDPDNSADTGNCGAGRGDPPITDYGQSRKRKKISDVWDYFTKIYALDINGKVLTFAACNHCCKILTASSKNGTSQLARHTCLCKFKPVAAGRNAKDSGGNPNVLLS